MSNSFTPYDRKSYKESKRRRRRAEIAEKTGKIMPPSVARRRAIIIAVIITAAFVAAGMAVVLCLSLGKSDEPAQSNSAFESDVLLTVVSSASPLTAEYVPELADFNGFKVNSTVAQPLNDMLKDAENQGIDLKIKSAYISYNEQDKLYRQTLEKYLAIPDYTSVRAEAAAQKETPKAGCSEAQTGLIIEFDLQNEQCRSFLERSCVNYGFVLRYPSDKESQTRHGASETLFRYTGRDNSLKMRAYGMCLEEYNDYLAEQNKSKN